MKNTSKKSLAIINEIRNESSPTAVNRSPRNENFNWMNSVFTYENRDNETHVASKDQF